MAVVDTMTARIAVLLTALAAAIVIFPDSLRVSGEAQAGSLTTPLTLLHLAGFTIAFGSSFWVTFLGGLIMFRTMPRHQFGLTQSKLFPAYFQLLTVCLAASTASFSFLHPWRTASPIQRRETVVLIVALSGALANLVIFEPRTVKIMLERHRIEKEEGIGAEIGTSLNKERAKTNPKLAAINKRFGHAHGLSSLANLVTVGAMAAHLWHLTVCVSL